MKGHPYLRAYMAGVLLPSWLLLVALGLFLIAPRHIAGGIVFPMAMVPNLWGLWNVLYTSSLRGRIPIGIFGALLPLIVAPVGVTLASALGLSFYRLIDAAPVLPFAMAIYYLAWKYAVAFFNRIVDL